MKKLILHKSKQPLISETLFLALLGRNILAIHTLADILMIL